MLAKVFNFQVTSLGHLWSRQGQGETQNSLSSVKILHMYYNDIHPRSRSPISNSRRSAVLLEYQIRFTVSKVQYHSNMTRASVNAETGEGSHLLTLQSNCWPMRTMVAYSPQYR